MKQRKQSKHMSFKQARTLRRLARRRGWDVRQDREAPSTDDLVRDADGAFHMTMRYSLDRRPS